MSCAVTTRPPGRKGRSALITSLILGLGACAGPVNTPTPLATAPVISASPSREPTTEPTPRQPSSPTPEPSLTAFFAPATSDELISEMTFRGSLGVTLYEFAERWNGGIITDDTLVIDPERFVVDAGSFNYEFADTPLALLGYVDSDDVISSVALIDATNLLDDRLARATSGLGGVAARSNLVIATEPGLSRSERAEVIENLGQAIELEGDQTFRYASTTSAAERAETVGYYLVADDSGLLWLIAVAG